MSTQSVGRRSGPDQRGQVLISFTLALALLLFGLFTAVVDLSVLYTQATRVEAAAQAGAVSGANAVSAYSLYHCAVPSLRTGSGCGSDQQSAGARYDFRTACELAVTRSLDTGAHAPGDRITCTALSNTQVQAHVEKVIPMPLGLFGKSFTVSSDFRASVVVR
ncbi:MAG: hypothetical protein NVSMB29_03910 [Candidatus Dormibacteria bacterium]